MLRFLVAALLPVAVLSCSGSGDGQRPATLDEISAAFVGRTASFGDGSHAQYGRDGSYAFTYWDGRRTDRGTYLFSDGAVCIAFDPKGSRCDKIMVNNIGNFTLVPESGRSFPVTFR